MRPNGLWLLTPTSTHPALSQATTEMGNPFYARQSYLAQEIAWGGQFEEVIAKPAAGEDAPRYRVQLDRCAGWASAGVWVR